MPRFSCTLNLNRFVSDEGVQFISFLFLENGVIRSEHSMHYFPECEKETAEINERLSKLDENDDINHAYLLFKRDLWHY